MDSAISTGDQFYIVSNGTDSAVEIKLNYTGFAVDMSVGRDGTLYISDYYNLLAYNVQTNRFETLATFNTIKNALGYDDQGNFYAGGGPGDFIDVISGSTYSVVDTIKLPFLSSPMGGVLVVGDLLYILASGRRIITVDLNTGTIINDAEHGLSLGFALSMNADGLVLYSGSNAYAIDPVTGASQDLGRVGEISPFVAAAAPLAETYYFYGTSSNDTLYSSLWHDDIKGGRGDDTLYGKSGDDKAFGGSGNDVMFGNEGNDTMDGGRGNDVMAGNEGVDRMLGGTGDDLLYGGNGNDLLKGEDGQDTMLGGKGNDEVNGGAGNDTVWGGNSTDIVTGGDDNDFVHGGKGNDLVSGGKGNDALVGGKSNDTVEGGKGDDHITGGKGIDMLEGGGGSDVFAFNESRFGADVILDFQNGFDKIEILGGNFGSFILDDLAGDALVLTSNGSILMAGVAVGDIDETDFIF